MQALASSLAETADLSAQTAVNIPGSIFRPALVMVMTFVDLIAGADGDVTVGVERGKSHAARATTTATVAEHAAIFSRVLRCLVRLFDIVNPLPPLAPNHRLRELTVFRP
jgi:hypothetical protein